MHNDTPLGTTMHFKELDRQAAPKSSALRSKAQRSRRGTIFGALSVALLRRVRAFVAVKRWSAILRGGDEPRFAHTTIKPFLGKLGL